MNALSELLKIFYWPICRMYARTFIGDRPADTIFRFLCSIQFWEIHHFWPNFVRPRRFSEYLWNRMLHDRDPRYLVLMDKLRARDFVANRVGKKYLIPLLWSGDKPNEISFFELPKKFVIKTNHGCGYNLIVKDMAQLDTMRMMLTLDRWLNENFCQDKFIGTEWGYKNIKPSIIIESFVEENGQEPTDYKFWCFSGHVEAITLHFDRFQRHTTRTFNRNFEPSKFTFPLDEQGGECQRPENFVEMVQTAESLAEGFDFMRVDLYNLNGVIYFGEFTPYPGGIFTNFVPARQDFLFGEKWKSGELSRNVQSESRNR